MVAALDTAGQAILASLTPNEVYGPESELGVLFARWLGDAEQAYDDYFGPVLNRAARIMAAAHGGQVLASGRVAELVAGSLPAGASLRDLGNHRLRDLTLPERLYQLVHQDIMAEFPPPLTLESSPNNLPLQTTEFLGRRPRSRRSADASAHHSNGRNRRSWRQARPDRASGRRRIDGRFRTAPRLSTCLRRPTRNGLQP
jgi:hypothetical protein